MKYESKIPHYKRQLYRIENELCRMIEKELKRLDSIIFFENQTRDLFREDVRPYMESIQLDGTEAIINTSFSDVSTKRLSDCIGDGEIDCLNLIELVEYLKDISV